MFFLIETTLFTGRRIDGFPFCRIDFSMKTIIDIPERLYKKAKIRVVELGQTLKQVVLTSLEKELKTLTALQEKPVSCWAKGKLLPEFARLQALGAFKPKPGDRSIDDIIYDIKADSAA